MSLAVLNGAHLVTSLDERRDAIIETIESAAVEVGRHLIEAKEEHPGRFMAWVEAELPFGIDKAERLMAITRSLGSCTSEMRSNLPPAYSALFHLARLPRPILEVAVDNGEVTPATTVREAEALARAANGTYAPTQPTGSSQPVDMPEPAPGPASDGTITVDLLALELMKHPVERLSADATRQLRRWLG